MNRANKFLLSALISVKQTRSSISSSSSPLRLLSTKNNSHNSKSKKSSLILQEFRRRREKGSAKSEPPRTVDSSCGGTDVVSGYVGLGLRMELVAAAEEISGDGGAVPSEIQCIGIPAVLDGKSVVLSSEAGSPRALAYLLPLVQLLRSGTVSMKPKRPRAVVLCNTEEVSDECFLMGKYISNHCRSKSSIEDDRSESKGNENMTTPPLGMLVGTPSEILLQIEEGDVFCDDVKYLVLDEADAMLRQGFGPMIQKIVSQLPDCMGIQTVVVTSPASEMIGKPVMEHVGEISAMMLEIDRKEVLDLLASPDAVMNRVAEALASLPGC
ncbi:PREDICTED: DEAD-box ATP-dependent RNA helicase 39-like [Tarenaya hassleriana]|uniref:DEAD-box ATP-dependent RNA helicase 39-like n=1 Tax=Tarenaya hassleriana TaxID=28532 RepID=UPI00053C99A0|nr:PREDICTED: DEAD-box ATP-dependent RNA helicase 39-like [Tarenaya hassleriana]